MKIAIYTCITGGYDPVKPPLSVDPRLRYILFSDRPDTASGPWECRPVVLPGLSNKDQNRRIKMFPHEFLPEFDATLYVDGSIEIVGDVFQFVTKALLRQEEMLLFENFQRDCAYAEAAACSHYSHDWIWKIARQMRRYVKEGFPRGVGLYEANVIIRKNTGRVRKLMEHWWEEYRLGARRDQLSLTYAAWKLGVPLGSLGSSDARFGHSYFRFVPHPRRHRLLPLIRKYINRSVAMARPYHKLFGLSAPVCWMHKGAGFE